jgi:mannose-6-phosphate isomerase-like protein (cupin superfamily)
MPKVSKDSATQVTDHGAAEDRTEELDGYTTQFVTIRQDMDLTPLLAGLPDDRCQCPHWGYVFAGKLTWHFADHDEVFEPGDAYYVGPGHSPQAAAGSEFLQFSPAEQLQVVTAVMARNMQAMQSA